MKLSEIKTLLDHEVKARNHSAELSFDKPDPLLVAAQYQDESIALICALFGYGNAGLIVQFLQSLDFSLLDCSEEEIRKALSSHYYRFQKSEDVAALFIALTRLVRREILRAAVFLWIVPLAAVLAITEVATRSTSLASSAEPAARTSSTFFTAVFIFVLLILLRKRRTWA